jgi:hypothetical protein
MSLNRTIRDFVVKRVSIKIKSGSRWVKPSSPPQVGQKYRLEITCGNKDGKISWGNQGDYNKVLLQIRVVPKGFKKKRKFMGKDKIVFYSNSSFTKALSYRSSFTLSEYKPTFADCTTYLYLMFKPGVPNRSFANLHWDMGIYGAVRNHHWMARSTK